MKKDKLKLPLWVKQFLFYFHKTRYNKYYNCRIYNICYKCDYYNICSEEEPGAACESRKNKAIN